METPLKVEIQIEKSNPFLSRLFNDIEIEDGDNLYELYCRLSHEVGDLDTEGIPQSVTEVIYVESGYLNDDPMDIWDAYNYVEKNKEIIREELLNKICYDE